MGEGVGVEKEKKEEVVTAVYKLNLHCKECGHAVEKYLRRTSGVHKVDIELETGKVTVKGVFDPIKIHKKLEKKTRKNIEWVSPKPKEKQQIKEEMKEKKEEVKIIVLKAPMHCKTCENKLKWKLLELKGIESVSINSGAQTCTVIGTVEEKQLIEHIRKKTHKHGEIVEVVKKVEEKVEKIVEEKGEKVVEKVVMERVEVDVKKGNEDEVKVEVIKDKEEIKISDNINNYRNVFVPYFVYCPHAPQWFSDENPNACCVF